MSDNLNLSEKNRQHLNLSEYAWNIIHEDTIKFCPDNKLIPLSSFINKVFSNYMLMDLFPVNIEKSIKNKRSHYSEIISQNHEISPEHKNSLIDSLTNAYKEDLKKNLNTPEKGYGKKIRLSLEVYENTRIKPGSITEEFFSTSGKYLSAVLENYASLPYITRESIFFHDFIIEFTDAINLNNSVTITMYNNRSFHAIPYSVQTDKLASYNYFVCRSGQIIEKNELTPLINASFRLCRIKKVKRNYDRVSLSKEEKKSIQEDIKAKDVSFLLGETSVIKIKLTPDGIRTYNTKFHLRPTLISREDDIFEFHTTEYQIRQYFFTFGENAEILSPPNLREQFKQGYISALNNYNE